MTPYVGIDGSVALVTGAASGIGSASALAFADAGAAVVVSDIDRDGGEAVAGKIIESGGHATFVHCDVGSAAEVHELMGQVTETFGRLDFAHNNAGIPGVNAPLAEQSVSDWDAVLRINLTGVFLCMREELAVMSSQGKGAIVNTASTAGVQGHPNLTPYVASKFGVHGITRTAAMEYGHLGIRINAVCPGATHTSLLAGVFQRSPTLESKMTSHVPMGRLGEPQDTAQAAVWLCSDAASYITGTVLLVDGGLTAGTPED